MQDDVERALAREIAHLHAVTAQINHKAASIDKELENLEIAAATIEDNLRSVEEGMKIGRILSRIEGGGHKLTQP